MERRGRLTRWEDARGYGFITPDDGGAPVFLHIKALGRFEFRPEAGMRLAFITLHGPQGPYAAKASVEQDARGVPAPAAPAARAPVTRPPTPRPSAPRPPAADDDMRGHEVRRPAQRRPPLPGKAAQVRRSRPDGGQGPRHFFSTSFLLGLSCAGLGAAIWWWRVPPWVALVYLMMSLATLTAYAIDKDAARMRRWRTSEQTLLMLGLLGGWPGALVAQRTLRHKTSKTSFQLAFTMTVFANVAGFVWLFAPPGRLP
jgi:uncharacterized membrane protein YsdA (DUF1294 family)/cold shock CspA family protein